MATVSVRFITDHVDAAAGGAGQPTPDGRTPAPGGWNRFQIDVSDLDREVEALREAGA